MRRSRRSVANPTVKIAARLRKYRAITTRSERDDARLGGRASSSKEPAASYSPRGSTPKYHRRGRA